MFFKRNFVKSDPDYFAKVVLEQLNRPRDRRCPIAKASIEVVELLCEHWEVFAPGCTPRSFFLSFIVLNRLLLRFYIHHLSTILFEVYESPRLSNAVLAA